MKKIKGLIAATFTPMLADGSLNLPMVKHYADKLKADGIAGVFVCGTTGEGTSLTVKERMQIAESWVAQAADDFRVIVQVGHNCLQDSQQLASHAQEVGAYAISAFAPCFFKPRTVNDLVAWCANIANKAPELPFYYYHIPSMTGVHFSILDFLKALRDDIPNFEGIKYTHNDLMDYGLCQKFDGGKYNILFGVDEILPSALAQGADGAVGSTYNYMGPLFNQVFHLFDQGELGKARDIHSKIMKIVEVLLNNGGGVVVGKLIMKLIGLDLGPVRLPLPSLENANLIKSELDSLDFFTSISPKKSALI